MTQKYRRISRNIIRLYVAATITWIAVVEILEQTVFTSAHGGDIADVIAHVVVAIGTTFIIVLVSKGYIFHLEQSEVSLREQHDKLVASEEQHRLLFEQMLNGIMVGEIIFDREGKPCDYRILKVNPAFEAISGLKAEEVIGQTARKIFPDRDHSWFDFFSTVALTGKPGRIEKFSTSVQRYVELQAYSPSPGRFTAVCSDITDRKNTERRLAELQHQQQAMLDNIPDLVWMKDCDSRFVIVNHAFGEAAGRPATDIVGLTDLDLWPGDLAFEYRRDDRLVMQDGRLHRVEEPLEISDGGRIWIETLKSPVFGEEGKVVGTTGIARDITDRKKREAERFLYEEQLARLAREISAAEERERRRLARQLHDDVGQTLALGKMKLQELRLASDDGNTRLGEEVQHAIEQCIAEVRSLTFQLSPPLLYEVSLDAAVEDLAEKLQTQSGIAMSVDTISDLPALTEEKRVILFQAIRELLINIIKHSNATTASVTLSTRTSGDMIIEVTDNGTGMETPSLFQGKSRGFGLFNIRERISNIGGRLTLASQPGHGVQATITVPLTRNFSPQGGPTA